MRIIFSLILILSCNLFAQDSTLIEPDSGTLVVTLTEIPADKGQIRVALAHSQEEYEKKGVAFRTASVSIKNSQAEVIFTELPYGDYAIKVFHDENEDGELDTNFLGIPSEAYGFSNNARGSFGPASWKDARFIFDSQTDSMVIKLE
jgi:uncharacterized protein (DUF2141 family)